MATMDSQSRKHIDRYDILGLLGQGGMATVYRAFDTRLEREVALKLILTDVFAPNQLDQILKRFEREAKWLARLAHPNIVRVYDFGEYESAPYLVLEYLPGGTLADRLEGKPMAWQDAVQLILPIARALRFAHNNGLIHRDIKPSNILFRSSDEPVLSDFGIAKLLEADESLLLTKTGMGIGTVGYMPVEQLTGQATALSDQYALGTVLYEMIAGRRPYVGRTDEVLIKQTTQPPPRPRQFVPELPGDVEAAVLKSLATDPTGRYSDITGFIQELENLLERRRTTKIVVPPGDSGRSGGRPLRAMGIGLAGFLGLCAFIGLVCGAVLIRNNFSLSVVASPTPRPTSTPTPTWTPRPTLTPTSTSMPRPTLTPTRSSIPVSTILFQDDFSDSGSGWPRTSENDYAGEYVNGAYNIVVKTPSGVVFPSPGGPFSDVIIEVDATKNGGPDNSILGVTCRYTAGNYYLLLISSDGYAQIAKRTGGDFGQIVDWQASSAIKQGNARNHVRAECIGDRLSLWVNGRQVLTSTDGDHSSGRGGLYVSAFDIAPVDILFDNFVVGEP
jgi:serine/threonine protein kinase